MELKKQQWCQSIHRCEHNVLLVNNIYFPDKIARVRARASKKKRRETESLAPVGCPYACVCVYVCASDVACMENCPMFSFHYEARHWYYNYTGWLRRAKNRNNADDFDNDLNMQPICAYILFHFTKFILNTEREKKSYLQKVFVYVYPLSVCLFVCLPLFSRNTSNLHLPPNYNSSNVCTWIILE